MNLLQLTETVLLQIECFWVLQELDEGLRVDDGIIVAAVERIYRGRQVSWREIQPLVRLKTTLSLLAIPLSYAARLS